MIVKNITRNTVISENLKIASSFLDRMFGLLLSRNPKSLLFRTRFGIHTFFLKSPIDALVLGNNRVVKLKTLAPNRILIYKPIFDTVIELPAGSINKSKTVLEDRVKIVD